ncbi:MAG: pyridoxal 5'-phosphate synthase glutaminase subunit PdxT [Fimbriimonas sp.]|nr:pyridoxal 5'-phosphate synthase glutaminase subunit PdxT [Fimbriimonas sp.]
MHVGVVAIQGDFEKHAAAILACGYDNTTIVEIRTSEELAHVERAIIPGGESTTVGLLMQRYGLGDALKKAASEGMPLWGTCMGMIMMAKSVIGRHQYTLELLEIEVARNAFGAQVHSFEDEVTVEGLDQPVLGVFIRAPIVTSVTAPAQTIAKYDGKIVGVRQGKLIGTSFHPELTDDIRLHRFFMTL